MKPDPQLVYAAKRIKASNTNLIQKSLTWYTHWCRVGNKHAMEVSEAVLRNEIRKAQAGEMAIRRAQQKAS